MLPGELQAYIFELAADGDWDNAPNLALVSSSAATWVQPRIFHTVVLQTTSSRLAKVALDSVMLKSPEFLGLNVKRLCITFGSIVIPDAGRIISACTGVTELALWVPWSFPSKDQPVVQRQVIHPLFELPLKRLELGYEHIVEVEQESIRRGSLPRWCTTLTHLDVLYWDFASHGGSIKVPMLDKLSALTHLAVDWRSFTPDSHEPDLLCILDLRPGLQVLLAYLGEWAAWAKERIPLDARIIYLTTDQDPVEEWLDEGPHPGKWTVAEEQIRHRKGHT